MFQLHPQLAADCLVVSDLELSRLLLVNNAYFPWLILVPRVENIKEIIELTKEQQHRLMDEIAHVSAQLSAHCSPDKLNVAALGNQVPQLHVHVIARFAQDIAWPYPVWGKGSAPYKDPQAVLKHYQARFA